MKIRVLHIDMGIGGAERLIASAAAGFKEMGHDVRILTCRYDPKAALEDTRCLDIRVHGSWIPFTIFGKFNALMATLKMMYLATQFILESWSDPVDICVSDQIASALPLIRLTSSLSLFYGHFPDLKLAPPSNNIFRKIYRGVLDTFEGYCLGTAHAITVNSDFTRGVFRATFPHLCHMDLRILYPPVDVDLLRRQRAPSGSSDAFILSLNRIDLNKNIVVAVDVAKQTKLKLVIAGGFDPRVRSNVECLDAIHRRAAQLDLTVGEKDEDVVIHTNVTDAQRINLIHRSLVVLYTPWEEHFGIVPVEAMALGKPVVACNSGGVKETVIHRETGYLTDGTSEGMSRAIQKYVDLGHLEKLKIRERCVSRALEFDTVVFEENLGHIVDNLRVGQKRD